MMMINRFYLLLASVFISLGATAQFAGNALDFDGAGDRVTTNVPALFGSLASSDFTFEGWVNPRGSVFSRIFFAQSSTTNFATVSTSTSNQIYFYVVVGGTTYSVLTTAAMPLNQWTHVTARWTASTLSAQVFFNGVLQVTTPGGSSSSGTSGLMVLGSRPDGNQFFDGKLDEVRVWSEARSLCEIQSNMTRSIPQASTNLITSYTFNSGVASGNNATELTLTDLSGSGFNGTLLNFALNGATSNWVASTATVTTSGNQLGGYFTQETATVCSGSNYTFPDGSTQNGITAQVIYNSTLVAINGCDSIVETTVNVNPVYQQTESATICAGESYTFPDGSIQNNITAQVIYNSNLQSMNGCDSIIETTVNVNPSYQQTESASICAGESYTFPDGSTQNNITAQVIYNSTLQSVNGCDSIIETTVNVNPGYQLNVSATICSGESYTFPDGSTQNNITAQVMHTSNLQTVNGCDSIIETTVNVNPVYQLNESATICSGESYTFPDGSTQNNITAQISHISNLQTANGCDSIITTTVSVSSVNTGVSVNGIVLTAQANGATYQWIDCSNFTPIAGATGQSFTPLQNGSYAVIVTQLNCSDTSTCQSITTISVDELPTALPEIYPNPTNGTFIIKSNDLLNGRAWILTDNLGKILLYGAFTDAETEVDLSAYPAGVYLLKPDSGQGIVRVVKQ